MRITPVHLHKNKLIEDYRRNQAEIMAYFDHKPFTSLEDRYTYLQNQTYERHTLAAHLLTVNKKWGAPEATFREIERLKNPASVVVIGGQQAGLLTGPLYTWNKIISIIVHARQEEKQLGVPVIPVFWIAGEDHDYDEINHTYYVERNKLIKHKLTQSLYKKQSLSQVTMDQSIVKDWVEHIVKTMSETIYTKEIYRQIEQALEASETFVDFFAHLIHQLFPEAGLVLVDSGAKEIRQIEKQMFKRLVMKQASIASTTYETKQQLERAGYPIDIELEVDDAHLFYHDQDNERILLKCDHDRWYGKNNEIEMSTKELLEIAEAKPERLSNNVVTRPLMQEYLFPVLSFIAGDGEIAYWATLKKAFHAMDMKMPPIIPRLSFTYVTAKLEKQLNNRQLAIESVLQKGTKASMTEWLERQTNPTITEIIAKARKEMEQAHEPIQQWSIRFRDDIANMSKKNMQLINQQLTFMEKRMNDAVKEKHTVELNEFNNIELYLYPRGGLQERVWSPFFLWNLYGVDWIDRLLDHDFSFEENHYLIYM